MEQLLQGKYAVAVATYENYGGRDATKVIKKLLTLSGAKLCGTLCEKIPFDGPYAFDTPLQKKVHKMATRLYHDMQQKKKYPVQELKQNILWNVGIKPFVLKKGNAFEGVLNRWHSLGLL